MSRFIESTATFLTPPFLNTYQISHQHFENHAFYFSIWCIFEWKCSYASWIKAPLFFSTFWKIIQHSLTYDENTTYIQTSKIFLIVWMFVYYLSGHYLFDIWHIKINYRFPSAFLTITYLSEIPYLNARVLSRKVAFKELTFIAIINCVVFLWVHCGIGGATPVRFLWSTCQ